MRFGYSDWGHALQTSHVSVNAVVIYLNGTINTIPLHITQKIRTTEIIETFKQ